MSSFRPSSTAQVPANSRVDMSIKPLIVDILRTGICAPGSHFLVEGVDACIPVTDQSRAVRLLLGDGELCIQALLRPELHYITDLKRVSIGSQVKLVKFEFQKIISPEIERDGQVSQEASGPDELVFLIVHEMTVASRHSIYPSTMLASVTEKHMSTGTESREAEDLGSASTAQDQRKSLVPDEQRPRGVENDHDNDDEFETMTISNQRATQRRNESALVQNGVLPFVRRARPAISWTPDGLSKALKLTPLRSIPNLPYKQNWTLNVLAVVASLSSVEPAALPPYSQRTARLADPSTSKQVHLTVFLDPETFTPSVGSVVLLLAVKNHRFDGGSLKKYGNEEPKESKWWYEDPSDLERCDVASLKKWWGEIGPQG